LKGGPEGPETRLEIAGSEGDEPRKAANLQKFAPKSLFGGQLVAVTGERT